MLTGSKLLDLVKAIRPDPWRRNLGNSQKPPLEDVGRRVMTTSSTEGQEMAVTPVEAEG